MSQFAVLISLRLILFSGMAQAQQGSSSYTSFDDSRTASRERRFSVMYPTAENVESRPFKHVDQNVRLNAVSVPGTVTPEDSPTPSQTKLVIHRRPSNAALSVMASASACDDEEMRQLAYYEHSESIAASWGRFLSAHGQAELATPQKLAIRRPAPQRVHHSVVDPTGASYGAHGGPQAAFAHAESCTYRTDYPYAQFSESDLFPSPRPDPVSIFSNASQFDATSHTQDASYRRYSMPLPGAQAFQQLPGSPRGTAVHNTAAHVLEAHLANAQSALMGAATAHSTRPAGASPAKLRISRHSEQDSATSLSHVWHAERTRSASTSPRKLPIRRPSHCSESQTNGFAPSSFAPSSFAPSSFAPSSFAPSSLAPSTFTMSSFAPSSCPSSPTKVSMRSDRASIGSDSCQSTPWKLPITRPAVAAATGVHLMQQQEGLHPIHCPAFHQGLA
jgi:hypothetical protein